MLMMALSMLQLCQWKSASAYTLLLVCVYVIQQESLCVPVDVSFEQVVQLQPVQWVR
jgi:hypothetical protein